MLIEARQTLTLSGTQTTEFNLAIEIGCVLKINDNIESRRGLIDF